ncbi:hypothetical protein MTR67_010717 [Solanum verrucosum]|uniref:Protein kinase domain-containing protein n=1 Tax=Solanum verrucosum TaxID=315347 RepID=A0AAF0TEF7_SOLVR|nr:hypothetical protein MTR67_010717 [Solanum verrucosum]
MDILSFLDGKCLYLGIDYGRQNVGTTETRAVRRLHHSAEAICCGDGGFSDVRPSVKMKLVNLQVLQYFCIHLFQYIFLAKEKGKLNFDINSSFVSKGPIHKLLNNIVMSFDSASDIEQQSRSQIYPLPLWNISIPNAEEYNITNPQKNLGRGSGLVFIPGKAQKVGLYCYSGIVFNLSSLRYQNRSECDCNLLNIVLLTGISGGTIAGIRVAVVLVGDLFIRVLLQRVQRIAVDKSVEFSYGELANASDNFSTAYKIGQGGFASVYYGELRGEKTAIKKMDMQSTKEFLAELKVLAHVHHLNLLDNVILFIVKVRIGDLTLPYLRFSRSADDEFIHSICHKEYEVIFHVLKQLQQALALKGEALSSISDISLLEIVTKTHRSPNEYHKDSKVFVPWN